VNVELVAEVTEKGAILPDGKALMTVEQAKAFIIERMRVLEMTVAERVSAALLRHDQLAYDLKQYQHVDKLRGENLSILNSRLAAIEKALGIEPFKIDPEHPGKGNWKLTAQMNKKSRPHAPRQIAGPVPDWQKAAAEEAKKLERELPPRCNIPDLVRRFGASRTKIDRLIGLGRLKAIREPPHTWISRESLVAYVREYGVPRPKTRQYDSNVS
jgi:hypothetical protein